MPQLGPAEVLVILVVGLLVFGPNRLPEVGRQVGRALHEAKRFQARISDEIESAVHQHGDGREKVTSPTRPAPTSMSGD